MEERPLPLLPCREMWAFGRSKVIERGAEVGVSEMRADKSERERGLGRGSVRKRQRQTENVGEEQGT